jgi:hypothetical protein
MASAVDRTRTRAAAVAVMLLVGATSASRAQRAAADTAKCDSIVFAARVDSVKVSLYVSASRADGYPIDPEQSRSIATTVATVFEPPTPFRVSVFSGPAQMRALRRTAPDTAVTLRAPTVTGVYRFWSRRDSSASKPVIVRASLIRGFDSAATEAILAAAVLRSVLIPPAYWDSMLVEVRFSTDSTRGAIRMIDAVFPRMPLVDAVPKTSNPAPVFPESEKTDTSSRGEVVLRFVVDREGLPYLETVEIVRATSVAFARAAMMVLPEQHFTPAKVKGCPLAQVVSYPFAFVLPETPPKVPPRH